MVGEIIKGIVSHSLAFTAGGIFGILYASNKYDEDPNKIFNEWSENAHEKIDSIHFGKKDEEEVVDVEVVEE